MLFAHVRTHLIVAPSTSIGKSIFSTGLTRASVALQEPATYLKPIGTGTGDGDDQARLFSPRVKTHCLFHFDEPVSPHLAVERSHQTQFPTDDEFASAVSHFARNLATDADSRTNNALYIESAGGVHSPVLSGTSQLDAYRPLLPPTILVASHELGGISTTISAYESLVMRGYDVDHVLMFKEDYYENYRYLFKWFTQDKGINLTFVDKPPRRDSNHSQDVDNMQQYYASLSDHDQHSPLQHVVKTLQQRHEQRLNDIRTSSQRTLDKVWWPFVQHGLIQEPNQVMVIDSAHGDHFNVYNPSNDNIPTNTTSNSTSSSLLEPTFDGSASWWTQCLGHSNPQLTLAAAKASGRYGHVMFPTSTNKPALDLIEALLDSVGKNWAKRVFFSDDGSTGMEVGLKMALRSFSKRENLNRMKSSNLLILGLKGSYHGDTIGAMDACQGSVYSDRVDWYKGRGVWLDSPTIKIEKGLIIVRDQQGHQLKRFNSLNEIYNVDERFLKDELTQFYRQTIETHIESIYAKDKHVQFGALVLEPIVMGAGGMIFVDPLYQRVLIDIVRTNRKLFPSSTSSSSSSTTTTTTEEEEWQGLPIIFDEVFVGLRRLGRPTASTFLGNQTKPDIACYAKILTGGLVPMSVTLSTNSIFKSFLGKQKVDALLHGHSYTAHAIGCSVANKTIEILDNMEERGEFNLAKQDWSFDSSDVMNSLEQGDATTTTWSLWSRSFVDQVSKFDQVEGVMTLGCVLVVYLKANDGAGYESTASISLLNSLKNERIPVEQGKEGASLGGMPFNVHARPLGNIVYFMSSLNSKPETLRALEQRLLELLKK
ncbi:hypothetical protein OIO90_005541 [Microbotryomycetes sp. JL221]|nr:hypothetical protein OIO90_005541 [Microbotryomycetes sp. JL221]